ncbi:MAG TPA: cysteine--tRNA ligase [Firmicutes bacterium]|nr:cysteine--tRNA ligase [Bacillota bacterium]
MKIYNSMSRNKDEFIPIGDTVKIYACGPTVYNLIHIGNARPLCVFDVLRRYLVWRGYKVKFVQNFTDVDDKMINRANEMGITVKELAEKYISEYKKDAAGLNVMPPDIAPRATENIDEIIDIIKTLIDKGCAYQSGGDVYFDTSKAKGYGDISHQSIEQLQSGARIEVSDLKRSPLDFALWKGAKPGEPSWDSPFGPGRPGWHIECSAMARRYLGNTIDIHCGGRDLMFPHHENETAQSRCANGCEFANYWMHNGHVNFNNEKMSKSKGNFFTVREIAQKYGYEPIRFTLLASHYRSPINFTEGIMQQNISALQRLKTCRENLEFYIQNAPQSGEKVKFDSFRSDFITSLDDDLNTADAIGIMFEMVKSVNVAVENKMDKESAENALKLFDEFNNVLGIIYEEPDSKNGAGDDDAEIERLISERAAAKSEKNYARADKIRNILNEMGVIVEDTPQGAKWRRK